MSDWFPKLVGIKICVTEMDSELYDEFLQSYNIAVGADIVVIASLGLWNGRRMGYKELHSPVYSDCFSSCIDDYIGEWIITKETQDLCARVSHHDGTNYYLYRKFKDISDVQRANFLDKIYKGTVTRGDITRLSSPLGKDILSLSGYELSDISNFMNNL